MALGKRKYSAAEWLARSKSGVSFNACHYMSGNTATGCAPDDTSAGITSFTDFTGLCTLLNTEADKHTGWALWKEETNAGDCGTGGIGFIQVILISNS